MLPKLSSSSQYFFSFPSSWGYSCEPPCLASLAFMILLPELPECWNTSACHLLGHRPLPEGQTLGCVVMSETSYSKGVGFACDPQTLGTGNLPALKNSACRDLQSRDLVDGRRSAPNPELWGRLPRVDQTFEFVNFCEEFEILRKFKIF